MKILDFGNGEKLIELKKCFPGCEPFFGIWLLHDRYNIIVDVGPARNASELIEALKVKGVDRLDYVFLTHIHIDHAGGLGELLEHFKTAKVICHEKAIEHLVEPSILWVKSLAALGDTARIFGKPKRVSRGRIIPHTQNVLRDLVIIETPGHAPHHLSFSYANKLFVGEAAGVHFDLGKREYRSPVELWRSAY